MRKYVYFGIVVVVLAAVVGKPMMGKKKPVVVKQTGTLSVSVSYARRGDMDSAIEVSGDIKALKAVQLSPKIPGRVVSVPYREGDTVRAGSVVVQQDTSDLRAQVQQAEAGLQAARVRLSQAITGKGVSDTQTDAQIVQARAALDSARAHLQMLKKGARTQERAQAENAVASAKANYENARVNHDRMRDLFSQGALSKQQMDLVRMQYDVASAQYDSAKQQLSLVQAGAREEEIEAAQKQVEQAQEAYRIARANIAQKDLRAEDIAAARAGVAQAAAALAYARQQVANASIVAPIAGTVSGRMTEPGQMATPGVSVLELVALNTVYFSAAVSEMDMHKIKVGQQVQVQVDALPGRKFLGSVIKVLPTADPKTRQFNVWVGIPNRDGELRPGTFARGRIKVATHRNTVVIPKDALVVNGDRTSVYTIVDSVARTNPVNTGFETREEVEVLSGVSAGDTVVVAGQDKLSDGVKVHVAD